jgi:hypothetical protein
MVFRLLIGRTDVLGRKAMPRIAASLAVLLTAVTCIGFNTARYPAVWQMVAGGDGLAQSDRSDDPAAAPQSESLAQSAAEAESAPSWRSDWQPDDDAADSTGWESTTVEPTSAYAGYEDGNSSRYSDEGSYRYSNDYDTDASDDDESAAGGNHDSWESDDDERVEQLAMPESWDQTASAPDTEASQSRFDPVAPQHRPTTSGTSYHAYAEEVSDSDRTEAYGNEVTASEDAVISPTGELVKAPASARYASYPFGVYGDSPDPSPASSGDALAQHDTDEGGELVPQSTLVPVKPATTESNGGESLARRPWANSLSLPDRVGSSGTSEVVPLPSVDEVSTVAVPEARPGVGEDAIPIYPTTMVE